MQAASTTYRNVWPAKSTLSKIRYSAIKIYFDPTDLPRPLQ